MSLAGMYLVFMRKGGMRVQDGQTGGYEKHVAICLGVLTTWVY